MFNRNLLLSLCAAALLSEGLSAQIFSNFSYQGGDQVYEQNPLRPGEFYNPILQGCYPDPSITRKGDDFYLVNSSFAMFPGVPIFHSTDLVNWKQIGHVLDRPSQLHVQTAGFSKGIYAPTIRYNPYNDTFYMITTQIAGGIGNMVVKTKDPFKGWGEIKRLDIGGIDPSIFFDEDGKAYVVHSDAPSDKDLQYDGQRVIKIWDYDLQTDQVIKGSDKILVNGGVDITKKPIWLEGPHLYKKDGMYYLMCAEGGTADQHSEVIFKSASVKGPFVPAAENPILTQRYLDTGRKDKVEWAGHADLVEGPNGKYYGVFLAVRPNEKNRVNLGRETFLLPVDWTGDYPVFENGLIPIAPKIKMPTDVQNKAGQDGFVPNGNFTLEDSFTEKKLSPEWIAMRGPREDFTQTGKNGLKINPLPVPLSAQKPVSALFIRQRHNTFEAEVTLDYQPKTEDDLAGITCYQSANSHYIFGVIKSNGSEFLILVRTEKGVSKVLAQQKIRSNSQIKLKVAAEGDEYSFQYALGNEKFTILGGVVSGDILSSNIAGGFTGTLIGLYATSKNDIKIQSEK